MGVGSVADAGQLVLNASEGTGSTNEERGGVFLPVGDDRHREVVVLTRGEVSVDRLYVGRGVARDPCRHAA